MKAFLKVIATLAVLGVMLVGVGLYLVIYQASSKTTLICDGKWDEASGAIAGGAETVFAVIQEYRPWIIWLNGGNSEGDLHAESHQSSMLFYAGYLRRISDEPMTLFRFQDTKDGEMTAAYRGSFKELTVKFAPKLVFTGTCRPS